MIKNKEPKMTPEEMELKKECEGPDPKNPAAFWDHGYCKGTMKFDGSAKYLSHHEKCKSIEDPVDCKNEKAEEIPCEWKIGRCLPSFW